MSNRLRNTPMRHEMLKQGVRQVEMAKALSIPRSSLGHIINNQIEASQERRKAICLYLGVAEQALWPHLELSKSNV